MPSSSTLSLSISILYTSLNIHTCLDLLVINKDLGVYRRCQAFTRLLFSTIELLKKINALGISKIIIRTLTYNQGHLH